MEFIKTIKERAKQQKMTIVLPESGDVRTLTAAAAILKEDVTGIILLGDKDAISKLAADNGLDVSGAGVADPSNYEKMDELAESLYELRKSKGMTLDGARELLHKDSLYLGVMMVKAGLADGMVAGAVSATADVLRPSLQILKTAPGVSIVSTFFVMSVPNSELGHNGVFVFGDCGLNQNPTAPELASIAVSSAASFRALIGAEPVVALLSHSTKGSAKHPDVDKVVEAVKIAKETAPDLALDGELQLDAAIIPTIGAKKAPGSGVAGRANVLIFPDLDSGNIGYKLVERLAGAEAYGPVTQGIAKPVNDLSRGCSASDIEGTIAITAVQAQMR